VRGMREDRACNIAFGRDDSLELDLRAMAGKMMSDIRAGYLVALSGLAGDDDDFRRLGAREQRHRVAGGARRAAAAGPAQAHATERQWCPLNVRHDQHRPPRAEERRLDDRVSRSGLARLGLADYRQVEPAGDVSEQVGRAADAGVESL